MAAPKEKTASEDPEEFDQEIAHLILGKFLNGDAGTVLDYFDEIKDPVVAAAVTVRICYELDPGQIAEFLAMLEEESEDEEDTEPEADLGEAP